LIKSQLKPRSEEFRANAARMRALVEDLKQKVATVTQGGDQAARDKHTARGKMLPRERVAKLLDPGSPFLEVGQLAGWGMYSGDVHSASIICGAIYERYGQHVYYLMAAMAATAALIMWFSRHRLDALPRNAGSGG